MNTKKYNSYEDPSHGWIEVEKTELKHLGIAKQITPYSYMKGNKAYLEEDCDFSLFYKTKEAAGEKIDMNTDLNEHTTNSRSQIRFYDTYKP